MLAGIAQRATSEITVNNITEHVASFRSAGDIVVFSIHWGPNWGYRIPFSHRKFARRLIDSGKVDLVHGHSSHHPKGFEVYKEKLILYGCGDFINDYEGIPFNRKYRSNLCLMYFPVIGKNGQLVRCTMVPVSISSLRLHYANRQDSVWLCKRLSRKSPGFGTRLTMNSDSSLELGIVG